MGPQKEVFDVYLESRLREWGNWIVDIKLGREGWPKESLISKVAILGMIINTSGSKPPISDHPRAEEVGYWIKQLSYVYPHYAEAVAIYYLNPNLPRRYMAKEINTSIRTFLERKREGKIWLNGYLTSISKDDTV